MPNFDHSSAHDLLTRADIDPRLNFALLGLRGSASGPQGTFANGRHAIVAIPLDSRSLSQPQYPYPNHEPMPGNAIDSAALSRIDYSDEIDRTNFRAEDLDYSSDDEELSEAESDFVNVQATVAQFKETLSGICGLETRLGSDDKLQIEQEGNHTRDRGRGRPRSRGRGRGRGGIRGPRKPAEPTGDIKFRLGKASQAFIEEDYVKALETVKEVIRINAETHEAWTLLASIFRELGEVDKTVTSLLCAAHLRPKDVGGWLSCARFAMNDTGELRAKHLNTAKICYSSALRVNPKEIEARCGKAAVLRELGLTSSAISNYKRVLTQKPHDTTILRLLAETYIDEEKVEVAIDLYRQSIAFYKKLTGTTRQIFGWSDINIYVELYAYVGQYDAAIRELKSLSRWLLGREQEAWWDQFADDREWDADDLRRCEVSSYVANISDMQSYGESLPLELRVKLGIYRLRLQDHEEAMRHFRWLDLQRLSGEDKVFDYADLFRETADALYEFGLHQQALPFYGALCKTSMQNDASLYVQMGKCYLSGKLNHQAEDCFHSAIRIDENHIEARVQLAKMYEALNEQEQAFIHLSEVMKIRRRADWKQFEYNGEDLHFSGGALPPVNVGRRPQSKPKRLFDPTERQRQENIIAARLQDRYAMMRLQQSAMRAGEEGPMLSWMEAAQELIEDFRGFKMFYPWDKYVRFLGYTGSAAERAHTGATPLDIDLAAMADRISHKLGADQESKSCIAPSIPENYRGISFAAWLDIFLEYALCLAKCDRRRESYEICEAAKDAIVFYHSREDMFLIHICWCTCALLANDEHTCVSTCRYFTREYQFTTDTYRMFAAVTRLCHSPVSWYCSGPTQKYILRQIKAMDYALVDEEARKRFFSERGSYSAVDSCGQPIVNDDMDVALLMLYGHILYSGTSYQYALNYFFRAKALDPGNPMINMSMAFGYIHYGLKRQSENRQFHIMQGLSFLFEYYDSRKASARVEERQEAHYNVARAYHMLGLTHLALPFYAKVLHEIEGKSLVTEEDLVIDAAYNLQSLHALDGNFEAANAITKDWLVI